MAEENALNQELVKGSVEVIKTAYTDALQPVSKEVGKALGTVGKTVNVALAPLRGVVWSYEKIEGYVHAKVSEKLKAKGITPENIITPDPDVAVPSIEALRYSKLKDEFANLLANSMIKNTSFDAHPSFVEILKQLGSDEAKILRALPNMLPFIILKQKEVINANAAREVAMF